MGKFPKLQLTEDFSIAIKHKKQ